MMRLLMVLLRILALLPCFVGAVDGHDTGSAHPLHRAEPCSRERSRLARAAMERVRLLLPGNDSSVSYAPGIWH